MATRRITLAIGLAAALAAAALLAWNPTSRGPHSASRVEAGGDLVALLRSEPTTYVRTAETRGTAAGDLLSLLTEGRLLRVNRVTDEIEPWLAEAWAVSDDHTVYTFKLREGIRFSDGTPFTSADVLFSLRAVYDPSVSSSLAGDLTIGGQPIVAEAHDDRTVVMRTVAPFAPGARLLANLPILPRHRLEAALDAGRLAEAWSPAHGLEGFTGLGPFVLTTHLAGQRLVFARNPHYWRRDPDGARLPYLDTLTVLVVTDTNTEALRMQAGEADLMVNGDIRPEDYAAFRRLAVDGRLRLIPAGVGLDPNLLWFNLTDAKAADPRFAWMGQAAFRRAISCAADREAIADLVYLGEAVPIFGPVTPANHTWYVEPHAPCDNDEGRARELLASLGLADRNGDGLLQDASGRPVRFSILTQSGHTGRERTVAVLQEQLRRVGITVDVVGLDPGGIVQRFSAGDYDAIYFGIQASHTDPALLHAFWLSSGPFHFWNPGQPAPASEWEQRIDALMREQAVTFDLARRQALFGEVQRIFEEHLPAIYFVAPKVTLAVHSRVVNEQPSPLIPQILWSADTLAVSGPRR